MPATAHAPKSFANCMAVFAAAFAHWLRAHSGAVRLAGWLAFAVPVTLFTGAVGVMREPTAMNIVTLAPWYLLYGVELWALLLLVGYLLRRLTPSARFARGAMLLVGACAVATCVELSTAGRGALLVEQGVALSSRVMHLYAFVSTLVMALLFFVHLQRSRAHEEAAARLAAAQAAQLESRRRLARARLHALQARIDPQLLFDLLESVRRSYDADPLRAEQLLDELVTFLRAALPRLRSASSSIPREAELTRAYAHLRALAGETGVEMRLDVAADATDGRFPPGVLLPLLDDALRQSAGACALTARRSGHDCELVLSLPATPTDTALARVRALLSELYASGTELTISHAGGVARATVRVPYELA